MATTQFGGFGFNDILKEEITKLIRTDQTRAVVPPALNLRIRLLPIFLTKVHNLAFVIVK